jgi:hypothetical protein
VVFTLHLNSPNGTSNASNGIGSRAWKARREENQARKAGRWGESKGRRSGSSSASTAAER